MVLCKFLLFLLCLGYEKVYLKGYACVCFSIFNIKVFWIIFSLEEDEGNNVVVHDEAVPKYLDISDDETNLQLQTSSK